MKAHSPTFVEGPKTKEGPIPTFEKGPQNLSFLFSRELRPVKARARLSKPGPVFLQALPITSQGHHVVVAGLCDQHAEVAASADLSLGGCDMPVILVTADELFLLL